MLATPLDPEDRVYAEGDERPAACMWFAKCQNLANGLEPHPALGQVPICARCHALVHDLKI